MWVWTTISSVVVLSNNTISYYSILVYIANIWKQIKIKLPNYTRNIPYIVVDGRGKKVFDTSKHKIFNTNISMKHLQQYIL